MRSPSVSTTGYADGLGRRVLQFDRETGTTVESLLLRPELSVYQHALRTQAAALAALRDPRFIAVRAIEPDGPRLVVASELIAGDRLSDIIEARSLGDAAVSGLDAAFGFLLQVLPALARLHGAGLVHGIVAPGRVILTASAKVALSDAIYGSVLPRLNLSRQRLWTDLQVVAPPSAGVVRFDTSADIAQASVCALMLALGRAFEVDDPIEALPKLVAEAVEIAQIRGGDRLAESVRRFFTTTLPLAGLRTGVSADQAAKDAHTIASSELGEDACLTALVDFLRYEAPPPPVPQPRRPPVVKAPSPPPVVEVRAPEPEPEPVYQEPVYQEPVYQEPVYQEPVYEPPVHATAPVAFEPPPLPPVERYVPEPTPPPTPQPVFEAPPVFQPPPVFEPPPVFQAPPAAAFAPPTAPEPPPRFEPAFVPEPVKVPEPVQLAPEPPPVEPLIPRPPVEMTFDPAPYNPPPVIEPPRAAAPPPPPPPMPVFRPASPPVVAPNPYVFAPSAPEPAPLAPAPSAAAPGILRLKQEGPSGYAPPRSSTRFASPYDDVPMARPPVENERPAGFPKKMAIAALLVMAIAVAGGKYMMSRDRATAAKESPIAQATQKPEPIVQAKTTPAAAGTTGTLTIESIPTGAKVLLDGTHAGETPLKLEGLPAGRHTVTLITESVTVKKTVRVEAGKIVALDVPVFSGWVAVFAPIVLEVSEGNKGLGSTEQGRILLPPGRHELTVTNRQLGYSSTHTVEISAGEESPLNLTPTGRVNLNAVPWAEVFVDGTRAGETPIANLEVPLGTREFLFKHPQHGERRVTTTITATPAAVTVDFTKPARPN